MSPRLYVECRMKDWLSQEIQFTAGSFGGRKIAALNTVDIVDAHLSSQHKWEHSLIPALRKMTMQTTFTMGFQPLYKDLVGDSWHYNLHPYFTLHTELGLELMPNHVSCINSV